MPVVMQAGFLVKVLTGEAQVVGEGLAVVVGVLVGLRQTEGLTFPTPDRRAIELGRRVVEILLRTPNTPIPLAPIPPWPKRWAAGLSYGTDKSPGVWVTRDLSRLRVGAEVTRNTDGSLMGRAMLGVAW